MSARVSGGIVSVAWSPRGARAAPPPGGSNSTSGRPSAGRPVAAERSSPGRGNVRLGSMPVRLASAFEIARGARQVAGALGGRSRVVRAVVQDRHEDRREVRRRAGAAHALQLAPQALDHPGALRLAAVDPADDQRAVAGAAREEVGLDGRDAGAARLPGGHRQVGGDVARLGRPAVAARQLGALLDERRRPQRLGPVQQERLGQPAVVGARGEATLQDRQRVSVRAAGAGAQGVEDPALVRTGERGDLVRQRRARQPAGHGGVAGAALQGEDARDRRRRSRRSRRGLVRGLRRALGPRRLPLARHAHAHATRPHSTRQSPAPASSRPVVSAAPAAAAGRARSSGGPGPWPGRSTARRRGRTSGSACS